MSHQWEEWVPRVYRFAFHLCGDAHVAEDLSQEAFLRAWQKLDRLRDERAFRVWIFRIVANAWRDQLRRGKSAIEHAGPIPESQPSGMPAPYAYASDREDLERTISAMIALPPLQRQVLFLSTCEELSTPEVATVLGISVESTKVSRSIARKKLRELLPDLCPDTTRIEP